MKVVIFCGGLGMRLRESSESIPKPMVPLGYRPILWHVMRYYAHFGHKDFILCLGYGAHHIKDFFLNYDETASNDFVLHEGGVELLGSDIKDWTITFVHTGLESPIGERLRRVRRYVEDEEMFLANYADVLTDAPLNAMIERFKASNMVGGLLAVPPQSAFHCVNLGEGDEISSISTLQEMPLWENGGYLMFRPEVFEHLEEDCDLIGDVCAPLAKQGQMMAIRHRGFWHPADTVKERTALEAAYQSGTRPWMLWDAPDRDPLQAAIAELSGRLDR
jgi:glucose-1-phosphate cytidylyltransferase